MAFSPASPENPRTPGQTHYKRAETVKSATTARSCKPHGISRIGK